MRKSITQLRQSGASFALPPSVAKDLAASGTSIFFPRASQALGELQHAS